MPRSILVLILLSGAAFFARGIYLVHTRTNALVDCVRAEEGARRASGLPWNEAVRHEVAVACQIARVERESGGAR